jgi:hypothetical protein
MTKEQNRSDEVMRHFPVSSQTPPAISIASAHRGLPISAYTIAPVSLSQLGEYRDGKQFLIVQ